MAKSRHLEPLTSSSRRKHKQFLNTVSLYEKLDTIPAYFLLFANVLIAFLSGPLRSKETRHPSLFYHVVLTAFRTMTRRLSARQLQYTTPHTDDTYRALCKKRGVEPRSEVLEDGTVAHWIGKKGAEKIILNFHGGGYVISATPDSFEFMFQMIDLLNKEGKSVACLFLSYDLAPLSPYPRQLQQAALLLQHTLNNLQIPPQNIILTGDSAGANLALSLLSHVAHPHPSSSPPIPHISLTQPLLGAVLICPWIDFSTAHPSYKNSKYKDMIGGEGLMNWRVEFLGGEKGEGWEGKRNRYNEPVTADDGWWRALKEKAVVGKGGVLVVGGGDEVLLDGILEMTAKMKAGMGEENVELFIGEGEFHDQHMLDLGLGVKCGDEKEGKMSRKIRGWISSKL